MEGCGLMTRLDSFLFSINKSQQVQYKKKLSNEHDGNTCQLDKKNVQDEYCAMSAKIHSNNNKQNVRFGKNLFWTWQQILSCK